MSDDTGKVVSITCRAQRPCGGRQAKITFVHQTEFGGTTRRYRCEKCKQPFSITL